MLKLEDLKIGDILEFRRIHIKKLIKVGCYDPCGYERQLAMVVKINECGIVVKYQCDMNSHFSFRREVLFKKVNRKRLKYRKRLGDTFVSQEALIWERQNKTFNLIYDSMNEYQLYAVENILGDYKPD